MCHYIKFTNAHGDSKITSIAFDESKRRLVTAANDGTVRMWNYNNGQLLKKFEHNEEMSEVTGRDAQPTTDWSNKVNHNTLVYQYRPCYTMPLYCTGALSRSVT